MVTSSMRWGSIFVRSSVALRIWRGLVVHGGRGKGGLYVGEEFLGVGIFEAAFCGTGDRCSEGRDEDDITGGLFEDVAEALL